MRRKIEDLKTRGYEFTCTIDGTCFEGEFSANADNTQVEASDVELFQVSPFVRIEDPELVELVRVALTDDIQDRHADVLEDQLEAMGDRYHDDISDR